VIDLHCHVLPGIDDGPETIDGSVALARAAAACGTEAIVATPHVSWHYPNEASTIARLTGELNERLRQEGVPIEVRAGAEIAMTRAVEMEDEEIERLHLGGSPWVLLEPPFSPIVSGIDQVVHKLQNADHRVLLAHPERCPAFQRDPEMVQTLLRGGALASITAGSLTGRFGSTVQRFTKHLVEQRLVHNVASDAHDTVKRPPGIAQELREAGLEQLTDWFTLEVPAALLAGEEIPARPATQTAARLGGRRLRWRRR
jgi:protein-tyrosine phosphatase